MKKIKFIFESGDILFAELNVKEAPKTAAIIWESLPIESEITQSRWSGREVNLSTSLQETPMRENQTIYTSIGEVCYWRDWRQENAVESTDVIAIYYGAEMARSHWGDEPVNVVGQVDYSLLKELKEIGTRIWREGVEKVRVERVESTKLSREE